MSEEFRNDYARDIFGAGGRTGIQNGAGGIGTSTPEYYVTTSDNTSITLNSDGERVDHHVIMPDINSEVVWRNGYVSTNNYKYEELFYMVVDLCKVLRSAIKNKEVSDIVDKILDLDDRLPEIDNNDDDDYRID
jgi:hypothetical protein